MKTKESFLYMFSGGSTPFMFFNILLFLIIIYYPLNNLFAQKTQEKNEPIATVFPYVCVLSLPEDAEVRCSSSSILTKNGILPEKREELLINNKVIATFTTKGLHWEKNYQPICDIGGKGVTMLPIGGGFIGNYIGVKMNFTPLPKSETTSISLTFTIYPTPEKHRLKIGFPPNSKNSALEWIGKEPFKTTTKLRLGEWQIVASRITLNKKGKKILLIAFAKLYALSNQAEEEAQSNTKMINTPAPEIVAEKWWGKKENLKQGPLLLEFWATWCGPCVADIPKVHKIYTDYNKRGLRVIGIHTNGTKISEIETFLKAHPSPYPICLDKNKYYKAYHVSSIPHYVLIDKSGIIVWEGRNLKKVRLLIDSLCYIKNN